MPMRASLAILVVALLGRTAALAACGDPGAVCAGGDCCAADCLSFVPAGTVCRSAAGLCDVDETCDGTSPDCPTDGFAASTTVCRSSAGVCDLAESCTGTGPACPADVKSTAQCRGSVGTCDVVETCDGIGDDCPTDAFAASTTVCRSSAGACDIAESCTGTSAACPPDVKSTTECRPAVGDCDVAETCDGASDDCPPDDFASSTTVCRGSAGACDIAETCSGTDAACPPDGKSTAVCRSSAGDCDFAEVCDGVGNTCPPDSFAPPTTPCRPAAGDCDVAENCTGTGPDCPDDVKSTGECRAAAGVCDVAEFCDGVGNDCPADMKSTAVCRSASGDCDVAESCDGLNDACPPDAFEPPTFVCRAASDQCDAAELCTGSGPACPLDVLQPNGTACDDGNACTRVDHCSAGVCTGTDPVTCTALDGCHVAGTCNPATGTCSNPTKPDNVSCNDGNPCTTADSCQSGVCTGLHIAGCCQLDAECDDGLACTDDRCVGTACTHAPIDERCGTAGECQALMCMPSDPGADTSGCVTRPTDEGAYCTEDGDPCTIDACRTGDCQHQSDNSGPRCPVLVTPYRTTVSLLARTRELEATLRAATAAACDRIGTGCDVAASSDADRLVALLAAADGELGTAALALAGRLADSSSASAPRDPDMRLRLAIGFVSGVPTQLRGFLATLAQARAQKTIDPAYARARRAEGRKLLTGTAKLRRQLVRAATRHATFAR